MEMGVRLRFKPFEEVEEAELYYPWAKVAVKWRRGVAEVDESIANRLLGDEFRGAGYERIEDELVEEVAGKKEGNGEVDKRTTQRRKKELEDKFLETI